MFSFFNHSDKSDKSIFKEICSKVLLQPQCIVLPMAGFSGNCVCVIQLFRTVDGPPNEITGVYLLSISMLQN